MEANKVHFFELETDGTLDLLEDSLLDALYEAGCDDALVGHRRLDFARRADSWEEALKSARADAESVPGVRIVAVKIDAEDIEAAPAASPAPATAEAHQRSRRSAAAV
jgi:hypothetical protein